MNEGEAGIAETLSRAKNTAINRLVKAEIIITRSGRVRLTPRDEMPQDRSPGTSTVLTAWKVVQQLIRTLDQHGESAAAILIKQLGGFGDTARDLAYRLFSICERKGWSSEALAYNSLVQAWPELTRLAQAGPRAGQLEMF